MNFPPFFCSFGLRFVVIASCRGFQSTVDGAVDGAVDGVVDCTVETIVLRKGGPPEI